MANAWKGDYKRDQIFPNRYIAQMAKRIRAPDTTGRTKRMRRTNARKQAKSRSAYGSVVQRIDPLADPYQNLSLGGFPTKKLVHLRYHDFITLNPTVAGGASHVFTANGLYDPNITGTGHQPNGFDQLMGLYNHYTVIDSTIRVRPVPTTGANTTPMIWDVLVSDSTSLASIATTNDMIESRMGSGQMFLAGSERGYNAQPFTLKRRFNSKRFFSVPDIVGKADYRGNIAANPQEQAFYHIWGGDINGSDPQIFTFSVLIDYVAVMTEPLGIAAS